MQNSEIIKFNVLMVDNNLEDALLVKEHLKNANGYVFEFEWLQTLAAAKARMQDDGSKPDIIFLDLNLPDSVGIKTIHSIETFVQWIPVIAMTALPLNNHDEIAKMGVQELLYKRELNTNDLVRSIIYAIGRHQKLRQAHHDSLTGLSNRGIFFDRLHHAVDKNRRTGEYMSVLIVDVDDFKGINDTYGHDVGDLVLKELAQRMTKSVRTSDTVSRMGGDEFAILLESLQFAENAIRVVKALQAKIAEPFICAGLKLMPTVSIGVVMAVAKHQYSVEWLFKAADMALYDAKMQGKKGFSVHTEDMDKDLMTFLQMDDALSDSVEAKAFKVHYQPVFDIATLEVMGFEALLRWNDPAGKPVSPMVFIPALEKLNLIAKVGDFLLDESIHQLAQWNKQVGRPLSMHINLSGAQFLQRGHLASKLSKLIDYYSISAETIVLELTETVMFKNSEDLLAEFAGLKNLGCKIAIDDFGMGYGSFAYLKQFSVDMIKIDRSFTNNLLTNKTDFAIVKSIISLAYELSLELVVEGIETEEQLDFFKEIHLNLAQGFLLAKPMDHTAITDLLQSKKALS